MDEGGLRILIVDHNRSRRRFLSAVAARSGCDPIQAGDVPGALAKVRECRPDMVVTDWLTSGADALDLVQAIRAERSTYRPYILLATEQDEENRLAEAFAAGVDDFIAKPLRAKVVAARLWAGQRIVRLQREREHYMEERRLYSEQLARSSLKLRELAITDQLTGLPNRSHALQRIQVEWAATARRHVPLSCLVIDLDGLKQINDAHGHERGDVVIKTVAAIMKRLLRPQDTVCRIGEDEFLVICPDACLASVMDCGERLMRAVGAFRIHAEGCPLGLSIGAAERRSDLANAQDLIALADRGMRHAKRFGKNQLCSEQEKAPRLVRGLSDVCRACKTRGRTAKGHACLWLRPGLPEDYAAAGLGGSAA